MAATKPTVLLVTGAFTTEACYDCLLPYLHKAGYPTVVTALPSANPKDPDSCSIAQDGEHVMQKHLLPLLHDGKDVVIYAHSLGATCLAGATEPVAKTARRVVGKKGGVLGLVYMSFAFVTEGQSQLEFLGGAWPPFCKVDTPGPGLLTFDPVIEILYNDTDPALHEELKASHIPTAIAAFTTPLPGPPLWQDAAFDGGHRVCIKTLRDHTFPPAAQDMFIANCGVEWKVVEVDGGHCAFIAKPEEVARCIVDAAEGWQLDNSRLTPEQLTQLHQAQAANGLAHVDNFANTAFVHESIEPRVYDYDMYVWYTLRTTPADQRPTVLTDAVVVFRYTDAAIAAGEAGGVGEGLGIAEANVRLRTANPSPPRSMREQVADPETGVRGEGEGEGEDGNGDDVGSEGGRAMDEGPDGSVGQEQANHHTE
ncbi:hypothetical protein LTR85_004664 [Meristemomyces frigidus]|nr:hypothetical protein LTR85_004664 [Meristemomyces frigidus]